METTKKPTYSIPKIEDYPNLEKLEEAHSKLYKELVEDGYYITLEWHDVEAHDFLMVTKFDKQTKVNEAAAKGTTPYELLALYGDPEMVATAFPEKENALYGDMTGAPEFFNEEALVNLAVLLNGKYSAQIEKRTQELAEEKAKAEKQAALDRLVKEKGESPSNEVEPTESGGQE